MATAFKKRANTFQVYAAHESNFTFLLFLFICLIPINEEGWWERVFIWKKGKCIIANKCEYSSHGQRKPIIFLVTASTTYFCPFFLLSHKRLPNIFKWALKIGQMVILKTACQAFIFCDIGWREIKMFWCKNR